MILFANDIIKKKCTPETNLVTSVFFFFFSIGWILEKVGYINNMSFTLLLCSARLFLYSIVNNPIFVLLVAILDGLSYGISYATITSYSNMISEQGTKTTAQATFNCIFDGIGKWIFTRDRRTNSEIPLVLAGEVLKRLK